MSLEDLIGKLGDLAGNKTPWYELPEVLGLPELVAIRDRMRANNLYDTEKPPLAQAQNPASHQPQNVRSIDGTNNDLNFPQMGAVGRRFGRNVPLSFCTPDNRNLLHPNPRLVSRELMTRMKFQPASIINVLAAAWLQFMIQDWFRHDRGRIADAIEVPIPVGDNTDWEGKTMKLPRSIPVPVPADSKNPPSYANLNTHWWDASQVHGSDAATADSLRSQIDGKLTVDDNRRLPANSVTGIYKTGNSNNWWLGLAMFHTIFVLEHNHICDELKKQDPTLKDQELYDKARLINAALTAKIHTVEWTTAIVPHPTAAKALRVNWYGIGGERLHDLLKFFSSDEVIDGIPGSKTNHHSAPYALTEEFVSVYRMHPLIPDDFSIRSASNGQVLEELPFEKVSLFATRNIVEKHTWDDLFYSFGIANPGAVRLNNYPKMLQHLTVKNEHGEDEELDMAAVDILRDRERGVPRYNRFRELIGKEPVKSFEELSNDSELCERIRRVYENNIDMVDLMTGLYAEPLPPGFGFSETAFRLFILMASRRLKSDRFLSEDYGPEVYTPWGIEYLKTTGFRDVLLRHAPGVSEALKGIENPFKPWTQVVSGN